MSNSYNNRQHYESTADASASRVLNPINADEQEWKHFLTNIRSSASKRLAFVGVTYIFLGLLSLGLESELLFDLHISYIGGFVNGLSLCIVGILTLMLCRQQVYVLTSLFVLVIIQLFVTLITAGFYSYFLYDIFDDVNHCWEMNDSECNRKEIILLILIGDLAHLFITFCLIIVNLIIIKNVRQPLIIPGTADSAVHNPQTQGVPVAFPNPYVPTAN